MIILQRLADTYIGQSVVFPPEPIRSQPGCITHIAPNALQAPGRGVSRTGNNDAPTNQRLFVRVRA
jgi:hypothetical protein